MLTLRPYQQEALDATFAYWREKPGNPLIVLPTGAGKSLVIAQLIKTLTDTWGDMRVMVATHVRELIAQNFAELVKLWPLAPAGIFSAGLGRYEGGSRIIFGGVQTMHRRVDQIGSVDLLIIDEAHLIPRDADTQYGKLIGALLQRNPDMKRLGLTATPYRMGEGWLHKGEDAMFDDVVYEANVKDLIDQGYLSRLISKATSTHYDLTGVGKVGGDYNKGKLQAAVDLATVTSAACDEVVAAGADRKSWLLFCSGVEHAEHVMYALRDRGIPTATVTGETPTDKRDAILNAFKSGELRAVTNNSVLTTGFNHPGIDLLAMMRPTLSTSLYVQMAGRGLRNAPGKANCLVLDFAGNVAKHGPIDAVQIREPGSGGGDAPIKICPECNSIVHASARTCPDCGHEFPEPETKLHGRSSGADIISPEGSASWRDVTTRYFDAHDSRDPAKPPTVRVEYICREYEHHPYREWLCPQHTGYAKHKADAFWAAHGGDNPPPATVQEWLDRADELLPTAQIAVRPKEGTKYFEITTHIPGTQVQNLAASLRASVNTPEGMSGIGFRYPLSTEADDEIPF